MITQEKIAYSADEIKAMVKTCEKYNKALERAKDMLAYKEVRQEDMEYLFPELEESKDERIRKGLIKAVSRIFEGHKLYDTDVTREEALAWLEKQGEKMTKPKFNVGDWITDGRLTCKVLGVTGKSYELHLYNDDYCHFETDIQSVDKYYRLWTIEDAKDGDVLVHNGCPFIFMGIKDGIVQALEENLLEGTNPVNFGEPKIDKDYQPAIKEQRESLFQKMEEAGYEWDAQKKEVKKIEVTSKESKDERIRKTIYGWICIQHPGQFFDNGFSKEEMLAWVEKQKGD